MAAAALNAVKKLIPQLRLFHTFNSINLINERVDIWVGWTGQILLKVERQPRRDHRRGIVRSMNLATELRQLAASQLQGVSFNLSISFRNGRIHFLCFQC